MCFILKLGRITGIRATTGRTDNRNKSNDRNTQGAGAARQRVTCRDKDDDRYSTGQREQGHEHTRCRPLTAVKGKIGNKKRAFPEESQVQAAGGPERKDRKNIRSQEPQHCQSPCTRAMTEKDCGFTR